MLERERPDKYAITPIASLRAPYNLSDEELRSIALELRKSVFEVCLAANSGHIGGSSSAVELFTALYFGGILRFNPTNPLDRYRDRVVVRGHLGPLRYSLFCLLGFVDEPELGTYRTPGSRLQGHEDHRLLSCVDVTPSGSLGMVLSYAVGSALSARKSGHPLRSFVFLGDGEEEEGNVSEAARHAAHLGLDTIIAILDSNGKQLSCPTHETDSSNVAEIWRGYGWDVHEISNGQDIAEVRSAYQLALRADRPALIIARTLKGFGLRGAEEHVSGYHTIGVCPSEIAREGAQRLQEELDIRGTNRDSLKALLMRQREYEAIEGLVFDEYFKELQIEIDATTDTSRNLCDSQTEYFRRLRDIWKSQDRSSPIYFLTADVTYKSGIEAARLHDYMEVINVGIREQHMIAMAHAISVCSPSARIIINATDAFTYRGIDQLNAMAQGGGSVTIISDIAGLTEAKNGRTHQTVGQPGAILTMPGVTLLEPGDTTDLFNCLSWALSRRTGVVFIRTVRAEIYPWERAEHNLGCITYYPIVQSSDPELTLVASGLPVGSSIRAAEALREQGYGAQVINVINQKSLDASFVSLLPAGRPVLTVYNGAPEILQGTVARAVMEWATDPPSRIVGHGFHAGTSGLLDDLMKLYMLDAEGIARVIEQRLRLPRLRG